MAGDSLDHEDEHVCEICGRTFGTEGDLDEHVHDEGQLS